MKSQNTVKTDTSPEAPKHTPWECDLVDCMVFDSRGIRVADCNNDEEVISYEQQEANSRLLAAAPELLAACKVLTAAQDASIDQFTEKEIDAIEAAMKQARAAIAKAEGRT